ncbi:tripartite tricarboxylate transporter substrate binding protein [Tardiphaga sp.]|uniref:Bug family tripartite tricarboxylate transporter substrate binding protein n=1 Tax=Tardiphaga sp. TaxID=1926292 RepID=UPI002638B464|nr:tripartite tricarboxylate transporter substrate binding protein [Tardiphaga sp.]MDB5618983.1 Tripartite-type tricarboxylate transporter, receptor component TctC [Tardiphaga sp.]
MRNRSLPLNRRQFIAAGAGAAALLSAPALVRASTWPNKPIRMLAGSAAGGQTDQFARVYGEYLSRELGQTVVVENKAGAGGAVAATELKRADPDGHTLMICNTTAYMLNPVLIKDIKYNVPQDFAWIAVMPGGSLPFVVNEKVGAKTLQDFIDYARKTEKVNVGTYAAGSFAHMVIVELNKQYGLKMEAVHYRGEAPMWTDLAGGSIDAGIGSYAAALPMLQTGKARAVAVSRRRIDALPDVATFREQGATSRAHSLLTFQGCVAPAKTPPEIVAKLSALCVAAGKSDRVRELLKSQGIDEGPMTQEASQAFYKEEAPVWAELAASLGPQAQ